ncbi:hypothetical protein SLS57_002380 [Botryosphaeria dothidea]
MSTSGLFNALNSTGAINEHRYVIDGQQHCIFNGRSFDRRSLDGFRFDDRLDFDSHDWHHFNVYNRVDVFNRFYTLGERSHDGLCHHNLVDTHYGFHSHINLYCDDRLELGPYNWLYPFEQIDFYTKLDFCNWVNIHNWVHIHNGLHIHDGLHTHHEIFSHNGIRFYDWFFFYYGPHFHHGLFSYNWVYFRYRFCSHHWIHSYHGPDLFNDLFNRLRPDVEHNRLCSTHVQHAYWIYHNDQHIYGFRHTRFFDRRHLTDDQLQFKHGILNHPSRISHTVADAQFFLECGADYDGYNIDSPGSYGRLQKRDPVVDVSFYDCVESCARLCECVAVTYSFSQRTCQRKSDLGPKVQLQNDIINARRVRPGCVSSSSSSSPSSISSSVTGSPPITTTTGSVSVSSTGSPVTVTTTQSFTSTITTTNDGGTAIITTVVTTVCSTGTHADRAPADYNKLFVEHLGLQYGSDHVGPDHLAERVFAFHAVNEHRHRWVRGKEGEGSDRGLRNP